MESRRDTQRFTIGYLTPGISDGVSLTRWHGVLDAAQEQDVNLICFPGAYWRDPGPQGQANAIYDLVSIGYLDGLVLGNIVQEDPAARDEFKDFYENRLRVPAVGIRETLNGIPFVPLDNYQGMREAVAHLVEVHGYRRIAFLRGPERHPYAQERYRAYTDVLQEYELPFEPDIITPPSDWNEPAIQVLLDERQLSPPTDFQVVVAVNDRKALNALEIFQTRGIRIPGDAAIVGFNDGVDGRVVTPPLTSVAMPFHEQGRQATEMLLALLKGGKAPEQTALPARLVVRQSCGCSSSRVAQAGARPVKASYKEIEAALATQRDEILTEMVQRVGGLEGTSEQTERLLDAFIAASMAEAKDNSEGVFLSTLNEILRHVGAVGDGPSTRSGQNVAAWQGAVSTLQQHFVPYLADSKATSRAGSLLHQARVMIGEAAERVRMYQALQVEHQTQTLREVGTTLVTTFDVGEVMDILANSLPRLGIPSAFLSLYEDPESPAEWSRLMLAYDEGGRLEPAAGEQRFPSRQLVPGGMPQERQYCMVVEPLYFREHQLGFAMFEVGLRDGSVYEVLRGQLSSALQGALLVQRVQERSAELARQQYILDTFMENVPDRIYFKDLESRITRVNKAHAIRMGLDDPSEEIGKSDFDFFPEEQARVKYEQEQEIVRTGQPILNLEEHDEVGQWSLSTKMPLRDEHGNIIGTFGISRDITELKLAQEALQRAYADVERQVEERTAELQREVAERLRAQEESALLQQEVIEAQKRAIQELSTPIIPVMDRIIVVPLIGGIDAERARDITRRLLAGIRTHQAVVVILDITGVPVVDSGVADHLNKTIQAARLKGARAIITGISSTVAETIVDLGIDWSDVETLSDLQSGLRVALAHVGWRIARQQ